MGEPAAEPVSPSIQHLETTWASVLGLCADLTDDEWRAPTGCPGWSVQDHVAHLVDYEATALGQARPEVTLPDGLGHVKNPLGEANELGVEARRGRSGREVLEELRAVTDARASQLRSLTADDLAREVTTPAGQGTVADMLTLRVMDTWAHEQDIRRALGRPGHATGPAVDEAVAYWSTFLPYVVGKRAGAPEGATVVIEVGDHRTVLEVVDGRARPAAAIDGPPTVTVAMPATTFAAQVGGRSDVPDDVVITGDEVLGRRIVAGLAILP